MQLLFLSFLALGVSRVIASPTASVSTIIGKSQDPNAGLLSSISSNVEPRASPPLHDRPHPPTPFVYRIDQERGYYINFTSYSREIPYQDGDAVLDEALQAINRHIGLDPKHERASWRPLPNWQVEERGVTLTLFPRFPAVAHLGDIRLFVQGFHWFMRYFGFIETEFEYGILAGGYRTLLAGGTLVRDGG